MALITRAANLDELLTERADGAESSVRLSVQAVQTLMACGDFTTITLFAQLPDTTFTDVDTDGSKLLEFTNPGAENITLAPGIPFKVVCVGGASSSCWLYTGKREA